MTKVSYIVDDCGLNNMDEEILDIFLEEAGDILEGWEELCLKLEKSVEQTDLDALFRAAHNLKGSSKALGF